MIIITRNKPHESAYVPQRRMKTAQSLVFDRLVQLRNDNPSLVEIQCSPYTRYQ